MAFRGNQRELEMSLNTHLATLEQRHQALDQEVDSLHTTPAMSNEAVRDLKRRKLQLKDEIERLKDSAD
jgi:hypothetical protein